MDGENGCRNLNGNSSSQDVHHEHFNGGFPSQTYGSIPFLPPESLDHGSAFPSIVTESHDHGSDFPSLVPERRYFGLEEVIDRFTNGKMREPVLDDPQGTITLPTSLDKAGGSGGIGKDAPAPQSPEAYFGLEEVIDRFTCGKMREPVLDPQGTITPLTGLDKADGSGGIGKDAPATQSPDAYFGLEEVTDRFTSGKMREPVLDPQGTITLPTSLDKAEGSGGMGKDTPAPPQSPDPSPTSEPQQPLPSPQTDSPEKGGGLEDEMLPHQVEMAVVKVPVPVEKVEVPIEKVGEWDGWIWRKYGKKMVNDSPHSKSYYRCNHEGLKCPAKKHVQLSHMDESKYIITYRGNHNHPPPVENTTTKPRKRSRARARAPAPPAAKEE